jgi:hypothetical protein
MHACSRAHSRPIIDGAHRVFLPMDAHVVKDNNWRWNKANVQSVGGGFTVQQHGPMRFYVGARTGVAQIDGNATAGMAELRRDGFASISASSSSSSSSSSAAASASSSSSSSKSDAAGATLVTRPLSFTRGRYLFVNADRADLIKVSVLDATTMVELPGLGEADYLGPTGGGGADSGDLIELNWKGGADSMSKAAGVRARLRFRFESPEARLFSFWVAETECGASGGWVAAGGPGYNSSRDTAGRC